MDTKLFVRKQPGGLFAVIDKSVTTGNIWWVDSGSATGADSAGYGKNPDAPFLTLDYAIGQTTANNGDIIYVMPGHAETYSTTGAKNVFDQAGIKVVGLGTGADRPTFTFSHTGATQTISANGVWLENLLFVTGIDSVTTFATISGADCTLKDIEARDTTDIEVVTDFTVTGDRLTVLNFLKNGYTGGNANVRVFSLNGVDRAYFDAACRYITKVTTAVIGFVSNACTGIAIDGGTFLVDSTTDYSKDVVDTIGGSSWLVHGYDIGAGAHFSGGSGNAVAGDDIGAVSTGVSTVNSIVTTVSAGVSTNTSRLTAQSTTISTLSSVATTISNGVSTVNSIATTGSAGVSTVNSIATTTSAGVSTVNSIATTTSTGVNTVSTAVSTVNSIVTTVSAGVSTVNSIVTTVSAGVSTVNSIATTASAGVSTVNSITTTVSTGVNTVSTAVSTVNSIATTTSTGVSTVNSIVTTVSAGVSTVNSIVTTVSAGVSTVNSIVTTVSNGVSTVNSIVTTVSNGVSTVNSIVTTVSAGVSTVSSIVTTISAGVSTVSSIVTVLDNWDIRTVAKSAIALDAGTVNNVFAVNNGPVTILGLVLLVTTAVSANACTMKWQNDPTLAGAATTDLCGTVDLISAAIGDMFATVGASGSAAVKYASGTATGLFNTVEAVAQAGAINLILANADPTTGIGTAYLTYRPLASNATVTAP